MSPGTPGRPASVMACWVMPPARIWLVTGIRRLPSASVSGCGSVVTSAGTKAVSTPEACSPVHGWAGVSQMMIAWSLW
jgi:hypothetical protein